MKPCADGCGRDCRAPCAQVKSESDPADAVAGCKALASMLQILGVFRTPVERAQIGQLLIQIFTAIEQAGIVPRLVDYTSAQARWSDERQ